MDQTDNGQQKNNQNKRQKYATIDNNTVSSH